MILESRWQGLSTLLIDTPLARCEIGLQGAQVLSYVPAPDGRDLLWCSPARLQPGRPVRGGIPLCWPWFSRQGQAASAVQHGFARRMRWELRQAQESADGTVLVTLALTPPTGGWPDSDWPEACTAEARISIGAELTVRLISRNDSDGPVRLTQALHTYLSVGDVRQTTLSGLQGLEYLDNLQGLKRFVQDSEWRFGDGAQMACDRIYLATGSQHLLTDPVLERRISVRSSGSSSTVVWNAGPQGILALGDVPAQAWPGYLCVEAANCLPQDAITLAPGAQTELAQTLAVL
jgi:glucose-6-phosphate 1-epimerase